MPVIHNGSGFTITSIVDKTSAQQLLSKPIATGVSAGTLKPCIPYRITFSSEMFDITPAGRDILFVYSPTLAYGQEVYDDFRAEQCHYFDKKGIPKSIRSFDEISEYYVFVNPVHRALNVSNSGTGVKVEEEDSIWWIVILIIVAILVIVSIVCAVIYYRKNAR